MAVPAFPSPSGRMLVNFDGLSVTTTSFDSGWIDVSAYSYLRIAHTCATANHKHIIHWSTNGIAAGVTVNGPVTLAGTLGTETHVVQARFGRFILDLAAGNTNAQLQCFFFESLNLGALKNLGTGAKIYSAAEAGIRSVRSSDASITVTENANEIDVTVTGGGSSLWELQGTTILKQKDQATVNNLLWQNDNAFPNQLLTTFNPTNCMLLGGRYSRIEGDGYNTIIGGEYNRIYRELPDVLGSVCEDNIVIGNYDSEIFAYNDPGLSIARRNCIVNCYKGEIGCNYNCLVEDCGIFGGHSNFVGGSDTNTQIKVGNIYGGYYNSIYAGSLNAVSIYNTIVGGRENYMYETNANCTIVGGRRFEITNFSGCVMTGDNSFVAPFLTPSANNEYTARFAGGYRLFTDAAATTGMTMAAGGSSWVAVSDVNKKDIHGEVDYSSYLEKLVSLPVYEYNYKGNPREQKCIGPTAQDYHALFGCECIEKEIAENIVVGERKIGKGEKERAVPIYEQVKKKVLCPAKDPLGIEQQDLIGICIAAIKGLSAQVKELSVNVSELQEDVSELTEELEAYTGEKIGTYVLVEPGVDANTGEVI